MASLRNGVGGVANGGVRGLLLLASGALAMASVSCQEQQLQRTRQPSQQTSDAQDRPAGITQSLLREIGKGNLDAVRRLLDSGADPNAGEPLCRAALENRIEIAQLLLERGAAVGLAIHYAAEMGYLDLVGLLLTYPSDRSLRDDESRTPLHLAAMCKYPTRLDQYFRIVDLLLEHGYRLEDSSSGGRRVIHLAGNLLMLEYLLNRGADINTPTTSNGATVLHMACRGKDVDRVRFLLEHGADVNAADNDGGMPIHYALRESNERSKVIAALLEWSGARLDVFAHALRGRTEIVLWMLNQEPDLVLARGQGGQTLLHITAARGNLELLKALLSRGADLEAKDRWAKWTPLHCAACEGHAPVVEYLIRQGAKVEAPGHYNQGILYTAAMQGHADVVRLLCDAGADVEATTSWGYSPLHAAARNGHLEAVKALLNASARINRVCKGSTALDDAVSYGKEDVALFLLERGADLNASRDTYSPPLHDAASRGSVRMIQALLEAGADVNRLNERGDTALDWAFSNGKHQAVKALRAAGGMTGHELTGPQRVAMLVRQLADDSDQVRGDAEAALRNIAPNTVPLLQGIMEETDDLEVKSRLQGIIESLP